MPKNNDEWLLVLQEQCDATSQRIVAARIGYSPSVISQVLKGIYQGDVDKVREKVCGAFMGATVDCPLVGEIPRNRCVEQQGRPFAATNPLRVQFYHTCPTCPNACKSAGKAIKEKQECAA